MKKEDIFVAVKTCKKFHAERGESSLDSYLTSFFKKKKKGISSRMFIYRADAFMLICFA